jgi:hypothetical protein
MERPLIAGAAGGVGTTTIAAALHAIDRRIYRANADVDVLVCRSTMYSLGCAQRALAAVPPGWRPVLAVVDDVPGASLSSNTKTRLKMTEGYVQAVVRVPFVADWRDFDSPADEAAEVLLPGDVAKPLRGFAESMRALVDELAPLLAARSAPPVPPHPVPAGWPGRH